MANLAVFISFSITNIATTIFPKLSGNVMVFEGGKMRPFFHPIMQTLIMSIGESLCLIPFYILSKNKQPNQSSKLPVGISIYFIPTLLDITSSLMVFISLNFISASLYSLLTVTNVIFIAFLSKIMLKSVFSNGQIIGSIIIAISAILAGLGEMLSEKGSEYHIQIILGIALVIISEGAHSYLTIYYEEIFKKYDVTPLQMVGYQGLLGTVCTTIIVIFLSFIGCPFPEDKCVFDSDLTLHVESAGSYINQLGNNHYLLILNLLFILFIARFNYDQCTVIANVNAFSLCVLSIFSNSLVWIVGITITVVGANNRQLSLQSLDTEVILVKLAALIVSTLGLLIYNQIIPLCLDKKPTKDDKDYSIIDQSD